MLHNSCIHSVTWHSCSVKLHHSINHVLCHPNPPPRAKYKCVHHYHPKL